MRINYPGSKGHFQGKLPPTPTQKGIRITWYKISKIGDFCHVTLPLCKFYFLLVCFWIKRKCTGIFLVFFPSHVGSLSANISRQQIWRCNQTIKTALERANRFNPCWSLCLANFFCKFTTNLHSLNRKSSKHRDICRFYFPYVSHQIITINISFIQISAAVVFSQENKITGTYSASAKTNLCVGTSPRSTTLRWLVCKFSHGRWLSQILRKQMHGKQFLVYTEKRKICSTRSLFPFADQIILYNIVLAFVHSKALQMKFVNHTYIVTAFHFSSVRFQKLLELKWNDWTRLTVAYKYSTGASFSFFSFREKG